MGDLVRTTDGFSFSTLLGLFNDDQEKEEEEEKKVSAPGCFCRCRSQFIYGISQAQP